MPREPIQREPIQMDPNIVGGIPEEQVIAGKPRANVETEKQVLRRAVQEANQSRERFDEWVRLRQQDDLAKEREYNRQLAEYNRKNAERAARRKYALESPNLGSKIGDKTSYFRKKYLDELEAEEEPTKPKLYEPDLYLRSLSEDRIAPESAKSREAEAMAENASPSAAGNAQQDTANRQRFEQLYNRDINQELGPYRERLARNPIEAAQDYQNPFQHGLLEELRRESDKLTSRKKAQVASNPLYNRPGTRYNGQKERALRKTQKSADRDLLSLITKMYHQNYEDSHKLHQNQSQLDANTLRSMGAVSTTDLERRLKSAQILQEAEAKRRQDLYKHAGVRQGYATKEEARDQAKRDLAHNEYLNDRDWGRNNTQYVANIMNALPAPQGINHHASLAQPGIATGPSQMLANSLLNLGGNMMPGREPHAQGGMVGDAVFNSMIDNTDPLDTLNQMMRRQMMLGLLQKKANNRQKLKKGGEISPIQSGAEMAKHYAIQERQLAEAERMRKGQEEPFMTKVARSIGYGMASSGKGHALHDSFKDRDASYAKEDESRKQSFELEKQVAKEIQEARKAEHQMLMDERRVKADERRATADERKASLLEQQLYAKHNPNAQPLHIGDREIRSKLKLGLSPQDQVLLRNIEEDIKEYETKQAPYRDLQKELDTRIAQKDEPSTGVIAEWTPNLSTKARTYNRLLNKVVESELPSGPATGAKIEFAKSFKPSERDDPKEVAKWAKEHNEYIGAMKTASEYARDYSVYNIPPRITLAAYRSWNEGGKKDSFDDYMAAVLEGRQTLHHGHEQASSPSHSPSITAETMPTTYKTPQDELRVLQESNNAKRAKLGLQ